MTELQCSRAGCRADAVWRIDWRNPRIHTGDRRKTWLACQEHLPYLRDYLTSRALPAQASRLSEEARS